MYTVLDVINKLIEIESLASDFYSDISDRGDDFSSFKVLAKVLAKEESKHVHFYENLKEELRDEKDIEIDFQTYDKISKIMSEFKNSFREIEKTSIGELLEFALNFEKDNLALLLTIRGKLVKTKEDVEKERYKALSFIVEEEYKHIRDIENLINYRK
ncbi:hypothetical protein KQI89_02240 [Clostridium sp. MSJ-4]|uniref:Rubrerythrin n=1 Tax=Clostridium simiarum TaxID=2841506 RepID=A0ABS6EY43_9CLOT|nr:hypothetical protein [Clostridium simiarum]MBU5590574.1 hypothetical protein [Clostridium simiarum]